MKPVQSSLSNNEKAGADWRQHAGLSHVTKRLKSESPGQPLGLISAEGSRTAPYCPLLPSSSLDGCGADWSFSADVLYVSVNQEGAESFSPLSLSL